MRNQEALTPGLTRREFLFLVPIPRRNRGKVEVVKTTTVYPEGITRRKFLEITAAALVTGLSLEGTKVASAQESDGVFTEEAFFNFVFMTIAPESCRALYGDLDRYVREQVSRFGYEASEAEIQNIIDSYTQANSYLIARHIIETNAFPPHFEVNVAELLRWRGYEYSPQVILAPAATGGGDSIDGKFPANTYLDQSQALQSEQITINPGYQEGVELGLKIKEGATKAVGVLRKLTTLTTGLLGAGAAGSLYLYNRMKKQSSGTRPIDSFAPVYRPPAPTTEQYILGGLLNDLANAGKARMNNDEDFEREQEEAGVISTQRLTYQEMTTTWRKLRSQDAINNGHPSREYRQKLGLIDQIEDAAIRYELAAWLRESIQGKREPLTTKYIKAVLAEQQRSQRIEQKATEIKRQRRGVPPLEAGVVSVQLLVNDNGRVRRKNVETPVNLKGMDADGVNAYVKTIVSEIVANENSIERMQVVRVVSFGLK